MKHFTHMLNFYAQHHQRVITKITHFIGVPLVFLAIQIFMFHLSSAWIVLIILFLYYLFLDMRLALITGIFLFLLTDLAQKITLYQSSSASIRIAVILFVTGWAIQFIGHYYEGKAPAFFKNIFQMLIAPIFLSAELCLILGHRRDLKLYMK